MRLIFFSASDFGLRCLESILKLDKIQIVGVVTVCNNIVISNKKKMENIHYVSFDNIAVKYKIPILYIDGKMGQEKYIQWIKNKRPDFGLAAGWYKKIPQSILNIPPKGLAGIHGSLLPQYRGGAPLVWAMIQGEESTGVSLFYFTEGIDEGDIIAQRSFKIYDNDYIHDVYNRMERYSFEMLKEELPKIADGKMNAWKQNFSGQTKVWPMRNPDDGLINWSQSAEQIYNFIRAQSKPYPGAFTYINNRKVYIWRSKPVSHIENIRMMDREFRSLIDLEATTSFAVTTGQGILEISDFSCEK